MSRADVVRDRLAAWLDPRWLIRRRWFRAKGRSVAAVEPRDLIDLDGRGGWLAIVAVAYLDGGEDRYFVPVVARGNEVREARDGDGLWRGLAIALLSGGDRAGRRGTVEFEPTAAAERLLAGSDDLDSLGERQLRGEQTNTSVVVGERLIVKLYRLLEPGLNPEVEVGTFLTTAAFGHTPPLGGSATWLPDDGTSGAVAMVQAFVPSHGDGWSWAIDGLASSRPVALLDGVRRIGTLTAELHAALASRPDDPAFPARPATQGERDAWRRSAEDQLDGALGSVAEPGRRQLAAVAPAIQERMRALASAGSPCISRIHGDYHLGQLLRKDDDFLVIDFEGEPARSLSERRLPSSPLRDVAGMLRSLDYAARTAARERPSQGLNADDWLREARAAFLAGYDAVAPDEVPLLEAFELEKACYEVRYEASNRPSWTWLPLDALERMAA